MFHLGKYLFKKKRNNRLHFKLLKLLTYFKLLRITQETRTSGLIFKQTLKKKRSNLVSLNNKTVRSIEL